VSEPRTLLERHVAHIGDVDVGIANVMEDTYVLPDGTKAEGVTAELIPRLEDAGNPRYTVGRGSVLTLGGVQLEVLDVIEGPRGTGRVIVRDL
jgi:hypothetical protein